ncbi:MAG: phage holin family protein [Limisphaerales bacterium]
MTKRVAQRLLVIVENRLQLLMVEAQEERERALLAVWLGLGAAAFGLLTGVTLTVLIAVALWQHSPVIALLVLALIYMSIAVVFYNRLMRLQKDWQTLPGTLDQLKKDRECLEKNFI